jgi:hypothetical protein
VLDGGQSLRALFAADRGDRETFVRPAAPRVSPEAVAVVRESVDSSE